MIKAGDLTKNSVVEFNGDPHVVGLQSGRQIIAHAV